MSDHPTPTQILEAQRAVDQTLAARDAARAQRDAAIEAEKAALDAHFAALHRLLALQHRATVAEMTDAERAVLRGPCPQGDAARSWVAAGLAVELRDMGRKRWKWTGNARDLRTAMGVE